MRNNNRSLLGSPVTSERAASQERMTEALSISAGWAIYPWTQPLGMFLSSGFRSEYTQAWQASDLSDRQPPVERRDAFNAHGNSTDYQSFAALGPVIGRVRDATPVLDARILEDRLTRTGSLIRPLSEQGRLRLAALLAMRGQFKNAHERADRYFWREVERVLQDDGALIPQGLDALSVLRILEDVTRPRTRGSWVARSASLRC